MKAIDYSKVKVNDGFWYEKQKMASEKTVYAVYDRFENTFRFDALKCEKNEKYTPHIFWDSDVAKWIEGVAYILDSKEEEKLEKIVDDCVDLIVKNADENGYFNSHYLVVNQDERFTIRNNHELYCAGHLIEAAVAYYEATGKDTLLKAMERFTDYIEKVFKIEKSAAFTTPGHPEIELALVRLYEVTGEKRYLDLSKYFIDEHGIAEKGKWLNEMYNEHHNQDNMPLRERTIAEGHCVRALYLYSAMADIAVYYNDKELLDACRRVFDSIVNKRMYVTGGVGSTHIGECFTADYDLPNRTAYAETCAAISLAMFCKRMYAIEADSRYADTAERALYNGVLAGVSMDGAAFFYENPLEIDPEFNDVDYVSNTKQRFPITQRKEVFDCSCCPPNIVRLIPSISGYAYTYDENTVYMHQYMDCEMEFEGMKIAVKTAYPADGKVVIKYDCDKEYLALRIPGWCKKFDISAPYEMKKGYAYIKLEKSGEIVLDMDMPVRVVKANRRVHSDAGRVAIMRGPVVYCAEGVDNGKDIAGLYVDAEAGFEIVKGEFILPDLKGVAWRDKERDELYFDDEIEYEKTELRLIPYYAYANRGESEMYVWLLKK